MIKNCTDTDSTLFLHIPIYNCFPAAVTLRTLSLLDYTVGVSRSGGESDIAIVNKTTTSYTVAGLESLSEYSVEVKAATAVGPGPGVSVTVTTRPPPGKHRQYSVV